MTSRDVCGAHARGTGFRPARTLGIAAAGLGLWLLAGFAASSLRSREAAEGLAPGLRTGAEAAASALGGFRGLAADFLWLRAIQMRDEGRHDEIALLCRLILELQPRFASAWSFLAWTMAYNIAFEASSPRERWRWIRAGLDLMERQGVVRNANSYALYWELGYMYFFRLSHKGRDPFYRHYQEELSPVPEWCKGTSEFVDEGLWSDLPLRYRLYRRRAGPGRVALGGASARGGDPARAERMYVLAVSPSEALAAAKAPGPLETHPLECGARLYADAPDRVGPDNKHPMPPPEADEPTIPAALRGARLVPLYDAAKKLDSDEFLALELSRAAEVWTGWVPDEKRNFLIARRWLLEAESKPDCGALAVPRTRVETLRVHALVEMGDWELAYEEFLELSRNRPPDDDTIPAALENFLLSAFYERWSAGDVRSAELWHKRLQAERPDWRMSPAETAEEVRRRRGW